MTNMPEKRKPWMKWYPRDWRAETGLQLVSRGARSVWLDMLGLMHESTLIGYLLLNGKKPTPEQLARVLGDDIRDLSAWLDELAKAGVYSETAEGIVYSRRMVRDHEMAEKGREDVKKRGGAWTKTEENTQSTPDSDPNRVPDGKASTQRPEARGQSKDLVGPVPGPTVEKGYPEDFEEFWVAYPRNPNMSKPKALKAWVALKRDKHLPDRPQMRRAVEAYRKFLADHSKNRPTPYPAAHAATWLNERRFEGFLEAPATPVGQQPVNTGPGWEAAYPETWAKFREDLRNKTGADVAWSNLFASCRAISETEIICQSPFQRDTLEAKFGEAGERLGHIFKAPVKFRYERPSARH